MDMVVILLFFTLISGAFPVLGILAWVGLRRAFLGHY